MPKFVFFSAHAENLSPLLIALNSSLDMQPPPASAVFFKFYKCESCPEAERHQVRVVYAPIAGDPSHEIPLTFAGKHSDDGLTTIGSLDKFLEGVFDLVVSDSGSPSHDFADICKTTYEQHYAFQDPFEYMHTLYASFGVNVPSGKEVK